MRKPNILMLASVYAGCTGVALAKEDLKLEAVLMADYVNYDEAFNEHGDDSTSDVELRRARLKIKNKFTEDWKAKLQIALEDDSFNVKDAAVTYSGFDFANIIVGRHKEAFGLERLTSSSSMPMMERSMAIQALTPGRSDGISLHGKSHLFNGPDLFWQVGLFDVEEADSALALTSRLSLLPWQTEDSLLHTGFSFTKRDLDNSEFRVNEAFEVYESDSLIEGERFAADNSSAYGLELIWQYKGLTASGEWLQQTVEASNGQDHDYDGGYVQMGYLLSGEQRAYKNGVLVGPVMKSQWETTLRYSKFMLDNENIDAKTLGVGVNYYLNKDVRFMLNYLNAKYYEDNKKLRSGDAFSLRVQFNF